MDTTIYKQAQLTLKKTTWALLQRTEGKDEQNRLYVEITTDITTRN